ncbi:MAG: diguanylate cyclase [Desulfobacteraceae bacterium]|nr:diguanylate cyclase [Desulfobacteraceae bacterium]
MDNKGKKLIAKREPDPVSGPHKKFAAVFAIGALSALLLFVAATSVLYSRSVSRHEQRFNEQQALQVYLAQRAIADRINWIADHGKLLALYSLPEFIQGRRDLNSLELLFKTEQSLSPENLAIYHLDTTGRVIYGLPHETQAGREAGRIAVKLAKTCLANGISEKCDMIVPPLHITNRFQILVLLFPVYIEDHLRGVMAMAFDLKPMANRYIAPIISGRYGAAYLLDNQGNVVYDHETDIIGKNVFDGIHDKYPDLLRVDRRLVSEPSGKDEYKFTVKRNDRVSRKLIAWDSAMVGDRKLVVCLSAPDMEIDRELGSFRTQSIILAMFLLVALMIMGLFFFRARQRIFQQAASLLQERVEQRTSELQAANAKLKRLSITDSLTGVYNRGYICKRLAEEVKKADRYGNDLSIILFDLDHFKNVNDRYGHQFGDIVLQRICDAVKESLREVDLFGRYGGEEFLVVLPGINLEQGHLAAERMRKIVDSLIWNKPDFKVTISGGIATHDAGSDSDLLKAADDLLYKAKSRGRNRMEARTPNHATA